MRAALVLLVVVVAGCTSQPKPAAFCSSCDLSNPINRTLLPSFQAANIEPQLAPSSEICARLAVDLLGHPISAAEAASDCSGDLHDAIGKMQQENDYLVNSERHWADRFLVNDVADDWRSLKDLYALVDDLHKGNVAYKEFAIRAIAHPGLMTDVTDLDARGRVRRVFRAFMGRPSTDAEEAELGPLFREWLVRQDTDPDIPILMRFTPIIVSGLCAPLAQCSTTMWGGAALKFTGQPDYNGVDFDHIDDATKQVLRVPGELFTSQPTFYEAAADDLLNRFLDWDEGDRNIRTPGFLFPEVREVVADALRNGADYRDVERLVLTSWLYTQSAHVAKDGVSVDDNGDEPSPLFSGPVKAMNAEAWLAGMQNVTSYDIGACDARYGDGFPYFQINQAQQNGMITVDQNNQLMQKLFELRQDRGKLSTYQGLVYYDYVYTTYARMLGGCPGFQATRQKPQGVSYAILQEGIAQSFCDPAVADLASPSGETTAKSVADKLVPMLLSRPATSDDENALAQHVPAGTNKAVIVSEECTAILGSAEMLFR
jgi:hypothetical protein